MLNIFPLEIKKEIKSSLMLSLPLATIQVAEAAIGFIDTVMAGLLGSEILAAGGLGMLSFITLLQIGTGLTEVVGTFSARAYSSEDKSSVVRVAQQGLWIALAFSLPTLLLLWYLPLLLPILGQDPEVSSLAADYLHAIAWGFPAALGFTVFKEVGAALERPHFITLVMVVALPLNILVNFVLIFGKWGFPALSLAGIGWSSTIIFWLSFLVAALYLFLDPIFREYAFFSDLHFDRSILLDLIGAGWPLSLQFGGEWSLLTCAAFWMGTWGVDFLAAHEITLTAINLALMVPWGISVATATRVAQAMGREAPEEATKATYVDAVLGTIFTSAIAIVFWFFPEGIAALYLDINDPDNIEVLQTTLPFLRIGGLTLIFYGLHLIVGGALIGIPDTRWPMIMNLCCYWGIGLGGGYIFGDLFHWQGMGLWWAITLGLGVSLLGLAWRFNFLIAHLKTEQGIQNESLPQNPKSITS